MDDFKLVPQSISKFRNAISTAGLGVEENRMSPKDLPKGTADA